MDTKIGTVALLTPEGERLVNAAATGDYDKLSEANYASLLSLRNKLLVAVRRQLSPEDAADPVTFTLEPRKDHELPPGYSTSKALPLVEPRAQAIRDCIEANRLQHRAAAVLGYDTVSELMSELPAHEQEAVAPETEAEAEGLNPETDEQPVLRHLGTFFPWGEDDPDADPILPEDIVQDVSDGRIFVTRDGLNYITHVHRRTLNKWLPKAGLRGPLYDLAEVERWLGEQSHLPVKVSGLCKEDLSRALRNIEGYRAEVERQEQQPDLSAQAVTKALQAAMALEKAGTVLGWSEVERLTGLRPAPRYARGRA